MSAGTALVTGASSGIGRAFARALAARGHGLVLVARRRERLEELADDLAGAGAPVEVLAADLATADGLAAVERRVAAEPALALVVNDAGFADLGPFAAGDPARDVASVRVLVEAPVRLTRAALTAFGERGGAVVQVSSRAAFGPRRDLALYAAAKAYLNRFTLALADELAGTAVRVLAVCPGNVRTEFHERAGVPASDVRAAVEPDEVVRAALAALDRGERLCVPGEAARDRLLRRLLPRGVGRKLAGVLERLAD